MNNPNVKTLLFGASDRHNFGDLLMPHMFQRLDTDTPFIVCGSETADMRYCGGHMVRAVGEFFNDPDTVNVIHTGGETLVRDGVQRYIVSKEMFKHPGSFIASAIGTTYASDPVKEKILRGFDYATSRDSSLPWAEPCPDVVVMVKELCDDTIAGQSEAESIKDVRESLGSYIAVQINEAELRPNAFTLTEQLKKLSLSKSLPVVLFCAGTAKGHDSLTEYVNQMGDFLPSGFLWHFDDENIWSICSLIANAKLLIATSLHACIVAGAYGVPRIAISGRKKVARYRQLWDDKLHLVPRSEYESLCQTAFIVSEMGRCAPSKNLPALYRRVGFDKFAPMYKKR